VSQSLSAKALRLDLSGLVLPAGLTVDEAWLEAADLEVDLDSGSVALPAPGMMAARVSEASLTAFLERKAPPGLDGFEVRLANGFIHAAAVARVIIPIRGAAKCSLRIEDQTRLVLDVVELDVPSAARGLVEGQLENLNPVFDAGQLRLPVRVLLEDVAVRDGWIELRGRVMPAGTV
jgi:hypothetical protein